LWYNGGMKHGLKVLVEHYKSKEHWYIKYMAWSIIGIVCFAILVHILKEFGFIPAQKIFDFFDAWATILYAGVTLLLAGVAVWSIMDNRYARRIDRKERLLNEIIEWAEDIRKSSSESIDPNEIIFDTPIEQMATQRGFYNLRLRYQAISVKSEYMEGIAKKVFGNELLFATEIVTQKLGEIIYILKDYLTNRGASQKEKNEEVETYKQSLDNYAEDLIREATKIKTKDIS